MKRFFVAMIALSLLTGCTSQSIEPTYESSPRMEVKSGADGDAELVSLYEKYQDSELYKSFIQTVDYGVTLNDKRGMDEPDVDIETLANLVIEYADKFSNIPTSDAISSDDPAYSKLYELISRQQDAVDYFKEFAEEVLEYKNNYSPRTEQDANFTYLAAEEVLNDCYEFVSKYINGA